MSSDVAGASGYLAHHLPVLGRSGRPQRAEARRAHCADVVYVAGVAVAPGKPPLNKSGGGG